MKCRACNANIIEFFSLGKMPLVNALLEKKDIPKEKKFDLSLGFCSNCFLVQLIKAVNPKDLFSHYLYFSSITKSIIDHSQKTALYFIQRFGLNNKSLVLEIGSNDGVNLQFYKKQGIGILGVDPAKNIAKVANKKGIKTLPNFFNLNLASKLSMKGVQADLVYGANVFAHVPRIVDFVRGVKTILASKGTAVFEFPYLKGLLENKFDTIYHEHVFYYSLLPVKNLFHTVGLEVYDVEFVEMQGGSLRVFIAHKNAFPVSPSVVKLLKKEKKEGFNKIKTYKKMNQKVDALKKELHSLLLQLKKEKKSIAGYGVPAKGVILLNYFGISKYLDFIVDKSPSKQGLYVPGVHLLINSLSKISSEKPDYVLILPWNISKEIRNDLREYQKAGGKFIIPIPKIKII